MKGKDVQPLTQCGVDMQIRNNTMRKALTMKKPLNRLQSVTIMPPMMPATCALGVSAARRWPRPLNVYATAINVNRNWKKSSAVILRSA